jgi:hypothetical protein
MHPYAPFSGVLLLPDRAPFEKITPVTLGDGQAVASIQWHTWTSRSRFEILDPAGQSELARGGREGIFGRRYLVHGPRNEFLLELKLGFWGVAGQSAVTLPDGRVLATKGSWLGRDFSVADGAGQPVARIVNTSRVFSFRQESLALELQAPVLSIVQAIGLAQCMRAALEAQRASASS